MHQHSSSHCRPKEKKRNLFTPPMKMWVRRTDKVCHHTRNWEPQQKCASSRVRERHGPSVWASERRLIEVPVLAPPWCGWDSSWSGYCAKIRSPNCLGVKMSLMQTAWSKTQSLCGSLRLERQQHEGDNHRNDTLVQSGKNARDAS